jgi:SNF2 family DNA or RNA helicase
VIHFDPWWNPAAEAQATDRAYRIGQDKPVFVHKLICSGTVEDRIHQLQQKKTLLADSLLSGAVKGTPDADSLRELLKPLT